MTVLLDYSDARPSPAQIHAFGAAGVLRYLCSNPRNPKLLTKPEAAQLRAAGLQVGLVWEDTADRAQAGRRAGTTDATRAAQAAATLGIPTSVPIFLAVDFDTPFAAVAAYFQGAQAAAIPNPLGAYGSFTVVEGALDLGIPYAWQTVAWSHGRRSPRAHLLQTAEPSLPGTDKNYLLHPLPLWGAPPPQPVTPPTPPTPAPADQEPDMVIVYVPQGPTALLCSDAHLITLTSNTQVDAYKAAGVPVRHVTQAQMDAYAAVSQARS